MTFTSGQIAWRLFLTCWSVYCMHFATNIVREIYPALTLGDRGSFNVYEYLGLHPDIFQPVAEVDEAFINNNPGASILGAIPYALTRPLIDPVVRRVNRNRGAAGQAAVPDYGSHWPMAREFFAAAWKRGLDVKFGLAAGVMQTLCMAPLSALGAVVMFFLLLDWTGSRAHALWLALLYAFATPVFFRSGQLNQNLLTGLTGFFAFAILVRARKKGAPPFRGSLFLAGLLSGWSVVCDFSGLVVLGAVALYGLDSWRRLPESRRSTAGLWSFSAGVLASAAVLMGYQWSSFGNPFLPAQHYMPPATYTHMGYSGMDRPHLDLLWQTAFGLRFGLFTSAPLLALALYPPAWTRRYRIIPRSELLSVAALAATLFLFCSANQYGRMQFNSGVRHIVPLVPFLFLVVAGVLIRMPRWAAVAAGIVGTYWSWCLAMYREVELGWGVLEPLRHITLAGPRLPWLTTIERMPQFPAWVANRPLATVLLTCLVVVLWLLWRPPRQAPAKR